MRTGGGSQRVYSHLERLDKVERGAVARRVDVTVPAEEQGEASKRSS